MDFGSICLIWLSVAISGILCTTDNSMVTDVFVERPNMPLCPERSDDGETHIGHAICGDVFEFNRLLKNGSYRRERRHIQNCVCKDTGTCQYVSDNMLRQSRIHTEYLCVPVRSLKPCRIGMTAKRMHIDSADFNDRTYSDISCTCPRHFAASLRGRQKATRYVRQQFRGFGTDHLYECTMPGRRRGRGRGRGRGRQSRRQRGGNNGRN